MQIRKANLTDLEVLTQLCITTFTQTYAAYNTPENMKLHFQNAFNKTKLSQELESEMEAYFLLMEKDLPIAFVKLNYNCAHADSNGEPMAEIQRIYVLQEHQGKGLGKILLHTAETEARRSGAKYLWLGVWQNNLKALDFYQKNGFTIVGTQEFVLGEDHQSDFVMQKAV